MSSSMSTPGEFQALIARSLALLEREHALAFAALRASLRGQRLRLEIGAERFSVTHDADTLRLGAPEGGSTVELRTTRQTLLALVEHETSLLEAVLRGRLELRGTVPALARFHDALALYLHGAVRSPSFPALLPELRHLAAPHLAPAAPPSQEMP